MKEKQVRGTTLTLKMKSVDFSVRSRSTSLASPTNEFAPVWNRLKGLVEEEIRVVGPIRLLGVKMSSLVFQ